jgi:cytochrome c biogenesis protein CcmG/thiol:disulfide interchange protein DsbE
MRLPLYRRMPEMRTVTWAVRGMLLAMAAVALGGCRPTTSTKPATAGRAAPDFAAKDLDGNDIKLSDYKGKVLVINYFATWCPPCQAEIPDFIEAYSEKRDQGVEFLGVNVGESAEKVRQFVQERGINYPVIAGDEQMEGKFGPIRSIPVTVFIDRSGKVAHQKVGLITREELEQTLARLLATQGAERAA